MINVVVEGESDREVAKTVVVHAGHRVHQVRIAGGKTKLDPLIPKYNIASAQFPWVVFRDSDSQCPVILRARLTAGISSWHPQFSLRIAHSMSEAWLLSRPRGLRRILQGAVHPHPARPGGTPQRQACLARPVQPVAVQGDPEGCHRLRIPHRPALRHPDQRVRLNRMECCRSRNGERQSAPSGRSGRSTARRLTASGAGHDRFEPADALGRVILAAVVRGLGRACLSGNGSVRGDASETTTGKCRTWFLRCGQQFDHRVVTGTATSHG